MKKFAAMLIALSMGAVTLGCTEEAQLQDAQSEFRDEQLETQEEINEALDDGVVTPGEQEEVREERGEDVEAAGDVADEAGEVIQERADE